MNIKPLDDRVIIEQAQAETKTAGGIVLPDSAKEKPQEGRIIACGPGALNDNGERMSMCVKKGDRVVYGKYAGTDIKVDGKEYKIMRERDILARIKK